MKCIVSTTYKRRKKCLKTTSAPALNERKKKEQVQKVLCINPGGETRQQATAQRRWRWGGQSLYIRLLSALAFLPTWWFVSRENQPRALSYILSWPFKSHRSLKSSTHRWCTLKQKDLIDSPLTRRMWKSWQGLFLWFAQTLPIPSQCLTVSGTLRKELNTVASNSSVFEALHAYEH